jgi:acetyltransferase-like isoleucine patch superfamily enzyme
MITVTRAVLDLFRERRIAHAKYGVERWRVGDRLHMADTCALEPYCDILSDHVLPEAMGAFSYDAFGSQGVLDYLNLDRKAPALQLHPDTFRAGPVTFGHDVWVGQGAMFSGGVTIGTGAVVAARALVTRDVPPYAIVGGTPAKIIRMRFSEELVQRLLESRWWRFGPDVLQPLDVRDPEGFVDRLAALAAEPLDLAPLTAAEITAAATQTQV